MGGAVQRNRVKRVLRAAMQPILEQIKADHDILLLARPGLTEIKSTEAQEILSNLVKKAGLAK